MKLLAVVDRAWPCDHSFIEEMLAKQLPDRGYDVHILMVSSDITSHKEFSWHGAQAHLASCSVIGLRAIALVRRFRSLSHYLQPDLVWVRNEAIVALYASTQSPPVAFQLSHQKEETVIESFKSRPTIVNCIRALAGVVSRSLRHMVMRRADVVFPVSEEMADMLRQTGERIGPMVPLPLGANEASEPTAQKMSNIRRSLGIGDQPFLLYVGTLNRLRRLTVIVEAFAFYRRHGGEGVLVFVGEGPSPKDKLELTAASSRLALDNHIRFVGKVPRETVANYIGTADIGLSYFPSIPLFRQNSPTKVMEYLAGGLPVVGSAHPPEQARIMSACRGGIVVHGDRPEEYARAIREALAKSWHPKEIRAQFLTQRGYDVLGEYLDGALKKMGSGLAQSS